MMLEILRRRSHTVLARSADDVFSWATRLARLAAEIYKVTRSQGGSSSYDFGQGFGGNSRGSWSSNDWEFNEGGFGHHMDDAPWPDMPSTEDLPSGSRCIIL